MEAIIRERLWECLRKENLTLKQLCDDLKISYNTIKQNVQNGKISKKNFTKIIQYLKCNPQYLIDKTCLSPSWNKDYFIKETYTQSYPLFCEWISIMQKEISQYSLTELKVSDDLKKFIDSHDLNIFDFEEFAYEIKASAYSYAEYQYDFQNLQQYFGDGVSLESYLMNICMDAIDLEFHKFKQIKSDIFRMHQDGFSKQEIAEKYPKLLGHSGEVKHILTK